MSRRVKLVEETFRQINLSGYSMPCVKSQNADELNLAGKGGAQSLCLRELENLYCAIMDSY
jgi:hypothetical protein